MDRCKDRHGDRDTGIGAGGLAQGINSDDRHQGIDDQDRDRRGINAGMGVLSRQQDQRGGEAPTKDDVQGLPRGNPHAARGEAPGMTRRDRIAGSTLGSSWEIDAGHEIVTGDRHRR